MDESTQILGPLPKTPEFNLSIQLSGDDTTIKYITFNHRQVAARNTNFIRAKSTKCQQVLRFLMPFTAFSLLVENCHEDLTRLQGDKLEETRALYNKWVDTGRSRYEYYNHMKVEGEKLVRIMMQDNEAPVNHREFDESTRNLILIKLNRNEILLRLYEQRESDRYRAGKLEEGKAKQDCGNECMVQIEEVLRIIENSTLDILSREIMDLKESLHEQDDYEKSINSIENLLPLVQELDYDKLQQITDRLFERLDIFQRLDVELFRLTHFLQLKEKILKNKEDLITLRIELAKEESSKTSYEAEIQYFRELISRKELILLSYKNQTDLKCISASATQVNSNLHVLNHDIASTRFISNISLSENHIVLTVPNEYFTPPTTINNKPSRYHAYRYSLRGGIDVRRRITPLTEPNPYATIPSQKELDLRAEIELYKMRLSIACENLAKRARLEIEIQTLMENERTIMAQHEELVRKSQENSDVTKKEYREFVGTSKKELCFTAEGITCLVGSIMSHCSVRRKPGCCSFGRVPSFLAVDIGFTEIYDELLRFLCRKKGLRKGIWCPSAIDKVHECRDFSVYDVPEVLMEPIICGSLKNSGDREQTIVQGKRTEDIDFSLYLCLKDAANIILLSELSKINNKLSLQKRENFVKIAKKLAENYGYNAFAAKFDRLWIRK